MSEHTAGTMTFQRIGCFLMCGPRMRADKVAEMSIAFKASAELNANGRRLAAAWNACAGIETEILETLVDHGVSLNTAANIATAEARANEAARLLEQAMYHQQEGLNTIGHTQQWNACIFCGGESKGYSLANPVEHKDSCPARAFLEGKP